MSNNAEDVNYSMLKVLGLDLDSELSHVNIDALCNKLSRVFYLFKRLASDLPEHFVKQALLAFYQSHVTYGTCLWGHCNMFKRSFSSRRKLWEYLVVLTIWTTADICLPTLQSWQSSMYKLFSVSKNEWDSRRSQWNGNWVHHKQWCAVTPPEIVVNSLSPGVGLTRHQNVTLLQT